MLQQTARKGCSLVPIAIVFVIMATLSIHRYSLPLPNIRIHGKPLKPQKPIGSSPIPRKIWQIFSTPSDFPASESYKIDPGALGDTTSWLALNPGYEYTLLGGASAEAFVAHHFADDPEILATYRALRNPGLKTDLLRYLALWAEGGVYSDLDTWALRPVDDWVPTPLRVGTGGSRVVRAVVGVEFDQLGGDPWPGFGDEPSYMTHAVQFCQWTLAAAPGHPLLGAMAREAVRRVRGLAAARGTGLAGLGADVTGFEVVTTTGPAAWTDVVFEELRRADPGLGSLRELSNMTEPRLFGDILVLTVDGFGMGQPHSHATNDGTVPDAALVKHNFRHSWLPDVP